MADDININLYDVIDEAESYFESIDITKKASGWKAYQRWLYENEPKYYPSGKVEKIRTGGARMMEASFSKITIILFLPHELK